MLDKQDLQAIQALMREEISVAIARSEASMGKRIDDAIAASEERMGKKLDAAISASETRMEQKIKDSECLLLDELDRVQMHLEKRIDRLEAKVDELDAYYRITRLDNDNVNMLITMYNNLEARVVRLEQSA